MFGFCARDQGRRASRPQAAACRYRAERSAAAHDGLIALTLPEIRHLITRLIWSNIPEPGHTLHRSSWRRRHQQRAKQSHYRRRGHLP